MQGLVVSCCEGGKIEVELLGAKEVHGAAEG